MATSETDSSLFKKDPSEALALELTCPICLQLFSEPVSLPCGHIYCLACLQTMGKGLDLHRCPECQAEYHGAKALVKNFKMCSIIDTYKASAGKVHSTANNVTAESNTKYEQDMAAAGGSQESSGSHIGSGSTQQPSSVDQEQVKDELKLRLASQVTELNLKLETAESVLRREKERESEVITANNQLREKASSLLEQVRDLSQSYSAQVIQLIEEELSPGEAELSSRVSQTSELTKQLRQAVLRVESLLTEEDEAEFSDVLQTLQPHIAELMAKPVGQEEDPDESKVNRTRACSKLEKINAELRERHGEIQRSLRNTLNPSEVTFDPGTAHPNLVLSEDLKTVTFSAVKQAYPSSAERFTSFFQILSTQSFCEGDHCWEVELEGSPWIIGVCHSERLARSGLPSALESSQSSWCLMWFNNMLTAFEQSRSVQLQRTTVSHRLEIRLSFKTHKLSFYNISPISGKTHVYTFQVNLTEPVRLAYRMMSGHPKARATIYS